MSVRADYRLEVEGGRARFVRCTGGRRVVGVFLLLLATGSAYLGSTGALRDESGGPASEAVVATFVALIGLPGLGLLTYASGVDFHRLRGEALRWWGFGSPWSRRRLALSMFDEIWTRKEVRSNGDHGSTTVFPIRLHGHEGFVLHTCRDAASARRLAETLARYLELPLRSALHGVETVRPWQQLDWSFRRRILAAGDAPACPAPPPGCKLSVAPVVDGYDVSVPQIGPLRSGLWLLALIAPVPFLVFAFGAGAPGSAPTPFVAFFVGIALLPAVIVLTRVLRHGYVRETLRLRRAHMAVERAWPWGRTATWSRASEQIEEVTVSVPIRHPLSSLFATGGMTLVTDQGVCDLARGASDEERAYLRDLIAHTLCVDGLVDSCEIEVEVSVVSTGS